MLARLLLYSRTARWLRPSQVAWFAYRRLRPTVTPRRVAAEPVRSPIATVPFVQPPQPSEPVLEFLGQRADAGEAAPEWHPADKSRLWRYNLHYFDYLHWDAIPSAWKHGWIDDWIERNPVGTVDAWEPYTTSLRLVNWIRYMDSLPHGPPQHWRDSAINQANWLLHNLEFHLLANHLFKNVKALVIAGLWFHGPVGRRLLRVGSRYLRRELAEQILPDGGHFERSPMYHCIVLEDCLDLLNVADARPGLLDEGLVGELNDAASRALGFLENVLGADGRIPLFNDSAWGIAAEPDALFAYGERLIGYRPASHAHETLLVNCPVTGYFGYRTRGDTLLVDCGPVGPDYMPGHAHCDTLSFEFCLDAERVVVDSGVHGYDDDGTRHYLRSTAAHNTVEFESAEQSEIWGTFRVARRARPLRARIEKTADGRVVFEGAHDGYRRLRQRAVHTRRIEANPDSVIRVADTISGRGEGTARSLLHFAPGLDVVDVGQRTWRVDRGGRTVALVEVDPGCSASVDSTYVAPHFGRRSTIRRLELRKTGPLPLALGYELRRPDGGAGEY